MNITDEQRGHIEKIMATLKCPKGFRCYKSGLDNLCKAADIGMQSVLECLEEKPQTCRFLSRVGNQWLCFCPVRMYIAKRLRI